MPDEDFEAGYDADTLVRAEEIRNDPKRLHRAVDAAEKKAVDARKAASVIKKRDESDLSRGFRRV